ncbi:hypothetical protein L9F63_012520, partial [Diploptera punctata]
IYLCSLQYQRPSSPSSAVFTNVNFFFCRTAVSATIVTILSCFHDYQFFLLP